MTDLAPADALSHDPTTSRLMDASLDEQMGSPCGDLRLWIDAYPRDPCGQMAMDEAMLDLAGSEKRSLLRFYRWTSPAVTIGYFDAYPAGETRPVVRRMTGGGRVDHGNDITFCLVFPVSVPLARLATLRRYEMIHRFLRDALREQGLEVDLAQARPTAKPNQPCFQAPVPWDLIEPCTGEKIAGGAQRRCRDAVIHQGSARLPVDFLPCGNRSSWMLQFASRLGEVLPLSQSAKKILVERSASLALRYRKPSWNEKRIRQDD